MNKYIARRKITITKFKLYWRILDYDLEERVCQCLALEEDSEGGLTSIYSESKNKPRISKGKRSNERLNELLTWRYHQFMLLCSNSQELKLVLNCAKIDYLAIVLTGSRRKQKERKLTPFSQSPISSPTFSTNLWANLAYLSAVGLISTAVGTVSVLSLSAFERIGVVVEFVVVDVVVVVVEAGVENKVPANLIKIPVDLANINTPRTSNDQKKKVSSE